MSHTAWNYTQDFLFGLPKSGHPATVSVFMSEAHGSRFFYDQNFGIEGSWMAILMNLLAYLVIWLIGRHIQKKEKN